MSITAVIEFSVALYKHNQQYFVNNNNNNLPFLLCFE